MNIPFGDLKRNYFQLKKEIDQAVQRVLDSGWFILGRELLAFEGQFAGFLDVQHAVGVGSGTEALHLALLACGVEPGDEVITVPNTAVPTLSAITFANAKPVFVDIDPITYCMDANLIEERISDKTKVILPVHEKILAKQSISPFTKKSQIFLSRYFKQFADFTLFHSFY